MTVRGHVDRVTAEGIVFGWCLDDARPGVRLDVTIRADGVEVGTVQAAGQRQDLRDAGLGDGRHGFIFTLPIDVLRQRRAASITAFEAATGTGFGDSVIFRSDPTTSFDDRLTRIEADLAVIRRRMQVSPSSDTAIATLFDAVGGFFTRLGQDLRDGKPSAEGFGLSGRMDVLAATYADIVLPIVAAPRYAVLLFAAAPMQALHATLAAIAESRMVAQADVFLLDTGAIEAAAMLPAVARNLRYVRLGAGVAAIAAIARAMHHETLVFMSGALPIDADWLDGLVEHLAASTVAGIAGFDPSLAGAGGPLTEAERDGAASSLRAVDGAGFAVRAEALAMCGGFDERYADWNGAVVDLCYRARAQGWSADGVPTTGAVTSDDPLAPAQHRAVALLERLWPTALDTGGGIAALLMTADSDADAIAAAVEVVREFGLRPVLIALAPRSDLQPLEASLLRCHVQVIWSAVWGEAAAVLARAEDRLSVICAPQAVHARLTTAAPIMALDALAGWLASPG